jgi:MFS superfamily sulfate permease-like transporter
MSADRGARHGVAARLARFVPVASWAPAYRLGWLRSDAIAGFTIWGLLIPEGIAYASLAGLPPQAGLYTLLASLVLYAAFGTSRQLVVAGTSAPAVLVYSSVSALHPKGAAAYGSLAAGLIILTGILFLCSGLLRLGFITQFLSRPVMEGFVFGLAIFVAVSQLPKLSAWPRGRETRSGSSCTCSPTWVTRAGRRSQSAPSRWACCSRLTGCSGCRAGWWCLPWPSW